MVVPLAPDCWPAAWPPAVNWNNSHGGGAERGIGQLRFFISVVYIVLAVYRRCDKEGCAGLIKVLGSGEPLLDCDIVFLLGKGLGRVLEVLVVNFRRHENNFRVIYHYYLCLILFA